MKQITDMPQLAKYIIGIAGTAIVLFIVWYFSNIVAYILISAVLAIIGKPLVDALLKIRINKWHTPRWLAALVALLTIWSVTILFFTFFIPLVFNKINELANIDMPTILYYLQEPLQSFEDFLSRFFAVRTDDFSLANEVANEISKFFNLGALNQIVTSVISVVGNTAIALFSITFITFFFLKEDNLFQNMIITLLPKRYEDNVRHAMSSITQLLIRYFTGIIAESTIIMLLLSMIFMIWGIDAQTAFFMGLVVGILNVIPYIGPIIGGGICLLVNALSPMDGYTIGTMMLITAGSVLFVQAIDNFIIQPVLYSKRVNAHPLEIFLVLLIAGSMAGVIGMLLAIPSYTVLRVFAKEFFYNFRLVRKLTENI